METCRVILYAGVDNWWKIAKGPSHQQSILLLGLVLEIFLFLNQPLFPTLDCGVLLIPCQIVVSSNPALLGGIQSSSWSKQIQSVSAIFNSSNLNLFELFFNFWNEWLGWWDPSVCGAITIFFLEQWHPNRNVIVVVLCSLGGGK